MLRKNLLANMTALIALLASASALHAAAYTEIQDNAFDGVNDASYVNHVFTWDANDNGSPAASQLLTLLEDTGPVPGFTGNVHIHINSTFQDYNSTLQNPARAYLTGGNFKLTFDYTLDGSTVTSHELSGPISKASIEITSTSPTLSTLTGIVNFNSNAGVENLPSSNNWPAAGESTAVALTFAIGGDLSAYKTAEGWQHDMPGPPGVTYDSQFSIFPEERPIPEPASLLMLGLGSLLALHRRRAV